MMKRAASFVTVAAVSIAFLSGASDPQADLRNRIIKATQTLVGPPDPSITQKEIVNGLLELLDIAAVITPEGPHKTDIKNRIAISKDLIIKDSLFNDKARQYLSFSYRMMTNGRKYERPKELEEFVTPKELQDKSLKYARDLVDKALASLAAGNEGETAKLLLELVLMTVTPVSG